MAFLGYNLTGGCRTRQEENRFVAAIEKQDLWLSPAIILTIGSVMTFVSLFYSPETKDLHLDQAGRMWASLEQQNLAPDSLALTRAI